MPYLRITCPDLTAEQRKAVATRLTDAVVDLFYNPRAPVTRDQLRERTTIHFMTYADNQLFIGGRSPTERGTPDLTVELSDWNMSVRLQRRLARMLTPILAELFEISSDNIDQVNIRFHPYPPTNFAVGGRLLSDQVPRIGRLMKWLAG